MISALASYLFGCRHAHLSFPVTLRKGPKPQAAWLTGTYVACTDCGKELPYDWHEMRVIRSSRQQKACLRLQPGAQ